GADEGVRPPNFRSSACPAKPITTNTHNNPKYAVPNMENNPEAKKNTHNKPGPNAVYQKKQKKTNPENPRTSRYANTNK
ncbi:hypothetical protein, partial [Streptomyces sp. BE230]|uniref:hypothetical protein n=1 Tax=Streptomyces sp. BE230 TaxID=3002526 RepID=UPI002ED336AD|nr:hypothetical protein [Streptomyces sp. BE230]